MRGSPKKKGLITLLIGIALTVIGFIIPSSLFQTIVLLIGIILLLVGLALWGDGVIKERKEKKKAKATDN